MRSASGSLLALSGLTKIIATEQRRLEREWRMAKPMNNQLAEAS